MKKSVGFIGAGNMTKAIVSGIMNTFSSSDHTIFVSNRTMEKAIGLRKSYNVNIAQNNIDLVNNCSIVFLSVKPNLYPIVLEEIREYVTKEHTIVSLAAGITIESIEQYFSFPIKIVRTMPNTAVLVGEGMTAITPNQHVTEDELKCVMDIFNKIGKVDIINEELMNAIPAISGSSPAYVYMFIEALADGGVLHGLSREKAYRYAAQAVLGAAKMVLEKNSHPGELKDMVCSPAGATIEAVYSLEKNNFRGSIIEAMNACTDKVKKLSESSK